VLPNPIALRSALICASSTMNHVLLHGFTGDRSTWNEVIEHWQPEQPPLAVDLPGHGAGPEVADSWDANLHVIARGLGPELSAATVVGYSLGARVALGLVASGRAQRAVLIGVNPGISEDERLARARADADWIDVLRSHGIDTFASRWEAQPLFSTSRHLPADARHRRQQVRRAQSAGALARSLQHMGLAAMPDYRPQLAALASRLTLVVGGDDAKFAAIAAAIVAQVPAIPLHQIPDSGHEVCLEQPRALAALLARLLG
jgi:2-succinyl-6-hydroxy-2,4-cyclohexadiene-1-carboxylate synthase